jgi:uroporphyrinogen decarboxylase
VPLQFDLCRALTEQFSDKFGLPAQYTPSYYEDVTYRISANDLRVAMGSDCVVVGASLPRGYEPVVDGNSYLTNEFGMVMRQGPIYMELIRHPMAHFTEAQQVEDFQFPDPLAEGRYDDAERFIQKYKGDYFIIGDMELTMYDMMQQLVGTEKILVDMAQGALYVEPLIDKCKDFALAVGKKLVSLGVDGIWAGDDFGAEWHANLSPDVAPLF